MIEMGYNKGVHRARLYALLLMLAFGSAMLGTMMLPKLREKKSVYNPVVKDKENELLSLQLLLQKEINHNKEIEMKNNELKVKIYALSDQKVELDRKLLKLKSTIQSLKGEMKVIESELEEKQNEIKMLQEKGNNLGKVGLEKENHIQKEAKKNELKHHVGISIDDVTIFPEKLTANRTIASQDKNEEIDQHSSETTIYADVTNDATELIEFKDGKIIDDDQIQ